MLTAPGFPLTISRQHRNLVEVRRAWAKQPRSLIPEGGRSTPLVVLDEIHKAAAWKRTLKGVWDTLEAPVDFLITGWEMRQADAPGPAEAARFENLVANHLRKACDFWTDSGEGQFELFFVRNKEKQEIDFLVTRDRQPWLPVEVKLRDSEPSTNWKRFLPHLPCRQALQLTAERGCWRVHRAGDRELLVASAAEALQYLP